MWTSEDMARVLKDNLEVLEINCTREKTQVNPLAHAVRREEWISLVVQSLGVVW